MRNFVMSGRTMTVIAAALVRSGDLVVAGALFGVAAMDAAVGEEVEVTTDGGVYDLPKASGEAWDFGQAVYWDAANRRVTETAGANLKIGIAARPIGEASAATSGRVRLNATF